MKPMAQKYIFITILCAKVSRVNKALVKLHSYRPSHHLLQTNQDKLLFAATTTCVEKLITI